MAEKDQQQGESARIDWHTAFVQAVQMELKLYREVLEFHSEFQLTSGPLRIDCVIIKKVKDIVIEKNIARIFRSDNLLEYKSPDDYLSVKDFLKTYAYANLYAAITPDTDLSEITLTFVESRYPRKLVEYLKNVRGYTVEETSPGIYTVTGDYIPIQIIESKKLSEKENLWLKSLTNDLEIQPMNAILKERRRTHKERLGAYLEVILRANPKTLLEVHKMKAATFEEVFMEAGIIPEWMDRGREEGREEGVEQGKEIIARNLLRMGMSIEEIAQATELSLEKTRALATNSP